MLLFFADKTFKSEKLIWCSEYYAGKYKPQHQAPKPTPAPQHKRNSKPANLKSRPLFPVRSVVGLLHWVTTPFTSAEELNYKAAPRSIMALNDFLCGMCKKTPKVAARCKHCFETLIPPDTSCVEEPLYRVLMHFFRVDL